MTQSRLVCYIDESGCSGNKYDRGSSKFLSLGAIVYDRIDEPEIMKVFDEAREECGHNKKFNKFSKSSDLDNFVLTKILSTKRVRIAQVALHKPSMEGTFSRSHHKEEYQYICKFIIERISWIARDSAVSKNIADTKCDIVFSEQKMYPYEDLLSYLKKLKEGRERYNSRTEWKYISDNISYEPHQNELPVHLADIVASSIHRAIEPKGHGMTDDRFIRNLRNIIYKKNGKMHGIKLFPSTEIAEMTAEGKFEFLRLL